MDGVKRIAQERKRQIEAEGWTAEHDAGHVDGELAWAAVCYAAPDLVYVKDERANTVMFVDPWPEEWEPKWDKRPAIGNKVLPNKAMNKSKRIRLLEKAGALIAAEIDRLLALEARDGKA